MSIEAQNSLIKIYKIGITQKEWKYKWQLCIPHPKMA